MAALTGGVCRIFPLAFNLFSKNTLPCISRYQFKRQLHVTRRLRADRQFTKKHEWISVDNGVGTLGVTDYAQDQLGDIVYVQLPDVGTEVLEGDVFGALESVKAAADVYSPASGTVTDINSNLEDNPELVNKSPYDEGWLVKIELSGAMGSGFMSEAEYDQYVKECQEED